MDPVEVSWYSLASPDISPPEGWLTDEELNRLSRFRFEKRKSDWLLGRWVAKNAVRIYLQRSGQPLELQQFSIRNLASGAPEIWPQPGNKHLELSISHGHGTGFSTLHETSAKVGGDLEKVEDRSDAFVSDYFTPEEQTWIKSLQPGQQSLGHTILWSTKESTLKALQLGLSIDTRKLKVECDLPVAPDVWTPLSVEYLPNGQFFGGFCQLKDDLVYSIVSDKEMAVPIDLATKD